MKEGKNRPSWLRGVVPGGKEGEAKPKPAEAPETPKTPLPELGDDAFDFSNVPGSPEDTGAQESSMEFLPDNTLFPDEPIDTSWDWQAVNNREPKDSDELAEMKKETALVNLYLEVSGNKPANFRTSIRSESIREYAPGLRSWTVESLHTYLAGPEVWKRPSFTQAVFEEIQARMIYGGGRLLPRE